MSLFVVGGLAIAVEAPTAVQHALAGRYGAFLDESATADAQLRVVVGQSFVPDFRLDEPASLAVRARYASETVFLDGAAHGWFDGRRKIGALDGATHLGEVDALFRLTLALMLPRRGSLLMHGAAVPMSTSTSDTQAAVLVGASGAGKSTAAAAFGSALGDELVVVTPTRRGAEVSGTPYWRGRPAHADVTLIGCLQRGVSVAAEPLRGSAALRALVPHVVRYVVDDEADRAIFGLAASLSSTVAVVRLACPEGPAFVPFLRGALAGAQLR